MNDVASDTRDIVVEELLSGPGSWTPQYYKQGLYSLAPCFGLVVNAWVVGPVSGQRTEAKDARRGHCRASSRSRGSGGRNVEQAQDSQIRCG